MNALMAGGAIGLWAQGGERKEGNTKYGKEVRFDLCTASSVADVFFGDKYEFGALAWVGAAGRS